MANDNKPIWKDYPLYCGNGDYVIEELVNGTWQTRKRFHVLRTPYGGGEVAANDMLCADLKTDYPETTGVTTHSAAYRRYRCQTGSTASQTQVFNFCQDWSYDEWDGEARALSAPINGHADMRQRLFRSRFGETEEEIKIKTLIRPQFSFDYSSDVSADNTAGYLTVTANEDYTIYCDASWIQNLGTGGTEGEQTFYFYIEPNTAFTDRSTVIEVTFQGYDGYPETIELPLVQRAMVPYFNVYPVQQSVNFLSGTTVFLANTNVPFSVSENASWLELQGITQAGYQAYNVAFTYNTNPGMQREAAITFTYPVSDTQSGSTQAVVRQREKQIVCEELWYLSTNGEVVQPALTGAYYFGANIVSNAYNEGQGIILFDNCVTKLGTQVFQNKTALSAMTIPDSVTEIGTNAFTGCTNLQAINLTDSIISIGQGAFSGCTSLHSIRIGSGVRTMDAGAFRGCTSLSAVTIAQGATVIGSSAFYGTALSSLTIPDSVTSIGVSAFTQCTNLSSVTIGSGVTVIPKYAFSGCTNLSSIVIPNSVTKIDIDAFRGCKKINVLNIPDSVTDIQGGAFVGCNISSVTIGSGVTILPNIFQNCSISAITIGSKVQQINSNTFIGSNVGYINVASGNTTFYSPNNCNAIMSRAYNTITVGGYRTVIPDFATSIGDGAFMGCTALSSITIPDSITAIRSDAFAYCSNLSTINYNGTKVQWRQITKGTGWHTNVPATVVHCTDGDRSLD